MIDIHHHLLPAIDDGSDSMETSIAMVEMAAANGITHIACTPHASYHWTYNREASAAKLADLQAIVGDIVTLGLGCDFHLSYENIEDALVHPTKYSINHNQYLLVELPDFGFSANMVDTFYNMRMAGITPILTHPERNPTLIESPERMIEWLRDGLLVQITAGSLAGRFGKLAERMARKLLDEQWVHFIATDAHNITSRPPLMREAYDFLDSHHGAETAQRLCVTNPRAVFDGLPLPPQPEPHGVFEDESAMHKNWLQRLLGR